MPNFVLMANLKIDLGCIINTSSFVDHDYKFEKYVQVALGSNLESNITIEGKKMIGFNSKIIKGTTIVSEEVLGSGSTVIQDIKSNQIVVGNPARVPSKN